MSRIKRLRTTRLTTAALTVTDVISSFLRELQRTANYFDCDESLIVMTITLALTKLANYDDNDEELTMKVQTKINVCDQQ